MSIPTVLVTGASRGLGTAVAQIAAKQGANVVITARSADALEKVAAAIRENGRSALIVPGDIADPAFPARLITQTIEQYGRLDALINNAGTVEPIAPLNEADTAVLQQNITVNLIAPMLLTQTALPHLRHSRGRVINVSSGAAVKAMAGWSAYCTAKAGLNHFTRVLAVEEPDVTAVAFRPGVIDTAMQTVIRRDGVQGMPSAAHARFVNYYEQGELLPPETPGRALVTLALHAPPDWSGQFLAWDDERVQALQRSLEIR